MRVALDLAGRGRGRTSPNPMVGAVLVKQGKLIGSGWHREAGEPHAEIEALRNAQKTGHSISGATLYVTLEPCCSYGRTPPCTDAIISAGIREVVVGATDPNPRHCGRAYTLLRKSGIEVSHGVLAHECEQLNETFNHWITTGTPFVTVKVAMTLDGKIATAKGESKWITSELARRHGMRLRNISDAVLVGINTVVADDPSLTVRFGSKDHQPRRIILDSLALTPLNAKVVTDQHAGATTVFVSSIAPHRRVSELSRRVNVIISPLVKQSPLAHRHGSGKGNRVALIDPRWILKTLGAQRTTSVLVEGGGEVNASFLFTGLAQKVAFFYAPKVLGGRASRRGVAGDGAASLSETLHLRDLSWRKLGPDLFLSARIATLPN